MSIGLPTITQIEYDAQVKAAYQSMGLLRPHVRVKTGVIGSTHKFRVASRGMAKVRIPQSDLQPLGQQYAERTATLTDWQASDYTDRLDQVLTNVDERSVLAQNIGGAIARRIDQMIIDALDAANGSNAIAHGSAGLTKAKLLQAKRIMDERAVPQGQRKLVVSAQGYEDLLTEAEFRSAEYVQRKATQDGMLPPLLGFDIIQIPTMDEGGLPISGTTRTCFAFDMQAVGLAIGAEVPLEVNYIPEKTSWLSAQLVKAGAVAIDPNGVVEIEITES